MDKMEETSGDQQNSQPQQIVGEQPQQQQIEISTEVTESSTAQLTVSVNGTESNIISTQELSPSIASTAVTVVSVTETNNSNMLDGGEYRATMPEPTYQTLTNGRMSPGLYNSNVSSYATLTTLQPLPPISSVTGEKYNSGQVSPQNVSGNFTFMQANPGVIGTIGGGMVDMNNYNVNYNKMGTVSPVNINMGSPIGNGVTSMQMMCVSNGYASTMPIQQNNTMATMSMTYPSVTYHQNGLHSPKQDHKMMNSSPVYDPYRQPMIQTGQTVHASRLHSPNPMMGTATMNGLHQTHTSSPVHSHHLYNTGREMKQSMDTQGSKGQELEEINTKELAQRISSELKRYSIPQAVFAQRVLCRSQGTLSDLLRNPKPWSKLKSGRETFRRMWKWLQEPEFQRMSALRLAGLSCKHKETEKVKAEPERQIIKKTRFVFTDVQRRTLKAIFKENSRPSKDMQIAIAKELGLEVNTVSNFFMNARRRSRDKWLDESGNNNNSMSNSPLGPHSPGDGSMHSHDSDDMDQLDNDMITESAFIKTEEAENAGYLTGHHSVAVSTMEDSTGVIHMEPAHVSHMTHFISNAEDLHPTIVKQEDDIKTELYDM